MEWLGKLRMRLRGLLRSDEVHSEMADEWRHHIELRTEENIRRGMSPDEAQRSAERNFGNSAYLKDESWDVRGGGLMERLWQDFRFGIRQLHKSPGFTAVALLSIGLGIGGNAVIFSLLSAILLRPLPISHPEEVFAIHQGRQNDPSSFQSLSYPNYQDLRDRNQVLSGMAVHRFDPLSLSHNGINERVWGYLVSGNYFEVLGVQPVLGRTFAATEGRALNADPAVVLSYACWQKRFGGASGIVGGALQINGHAFTVIGVAPPGFTGTESVFTPEFWIPSTMQEWIETRSGLEYRGDGQWWAFGRLKPGVKWEQAQAQLNSVAEALGKQYPDTDQGMALRLTPPGLIAPEIRSAVIAFSAALMLTVLLVLLIACTNLASLLLARATQRQREIAVRMAIGATRARLVWQLLTESLTLSVVGAALGLAMGYALIQVALASLPRIDFALGLDLRLDWRVMTFVAGLAVLTGVGFGLVPALHASKSDVVSALKEDIAGGRRKAWLRSALVTMQVTLSFVLLITAGLTLRSLQHTEILGPGFNPNNAVTASVDLGLQGYTEEKGEAFYKQLVEKVRALPGVKSAAWIARLPLGLDQNTSDAWPAGQPQPRREDMPSVIYNSVGPDYFAAMAIPIVAGRDFADSDTGKSAKVVIVNETLAQKFWPGQEAVGKHLHTGNTGTDTVEIVGIAKNGKYFSLAEIPALIVYYPLTQMYSTSAALVARTEIEPASLISSIRREVQKLDPALPIYEAKTLKEHMYLALFPLHAGAVVAGGFALLAMILAAIGIYGVMAYSVGQRTQEIGIRMALGAGAGDVWTMVLKQGLFITAIGMALGVLCAIGASSVVANLLVGVSATDPLTFLLITLLLSAVAVAACFIPARRATKVDPVLAIRNL